MPLKTHKKSDTKKYPHHYNKVYWPYIPLVLIVLSGLWWGHPVAERSQRGVLGYSTKISVQDLVKDTNQARQANHQPILTTNNQLNAAAQTKAQDMASRNYWSHLTPDGKTPWTFISSTGYGFQKAGENLAYGFATDQDVVNGWMSSPAHRDNMLDSAYQEVGFGIAKSPNYQNSGPETVVVAFYASPGTPIGTVQSTPSTKAFTTSQNGKESNTTVNKAETLTKGRAPWITFALGLTGGLALAYVLIKHSVLIHRKLRRGEKYVLKHPVVDVTVIAFVALCALLSQSVGLIR